MIIKDFKSLEVIMNNVFRILAKPAKLAKVVTHGLCELRGLSVKNTIKQFVITEDV